MGEISTNLTRDCPHLKEEHCTSVMKETEELHTDIPCSWIARVDIVKM
jgi:hypothetical protein